MRYIRQSRFMTADMDGRSTGNARSSFQQKAVEFVKQGVELYKELSVINARIDAMWLDALRLQ